MATTGKRWSQMGRGEPMTWSTATSTKFERLTMRLEDDNQR
ncbi:hypothetical protein T02_4380 [Trichinella nativa]|uniref:Uncharacterized protein n=1 Tax=Trichinella nativa TaxID=6335 RepID=A0A0V1KK53_9BILA|nr:hypothetical protein T02_4380 [Trichinella nativa]